MAHIHVFFTDWDTKQILTLFWILQYAHFSEVMCISMEHFIFLIYWEYYPQ